MTTWRRKASLLLLAASLAAGAGAGAQPPDRSHLRALSVPELKAAYLRCDRIASTAILDVATAGECSMISEELLERSFGGDFRRMLDWWRAARQTRPGCGRDADCRQR